MNYIHQRYDRLFSTCVAGALFASAIMVSLKTGSFQDSFSEVREPVPVTEPPADDGALPQSVEQAKSALNQPPAWNIEKDDETGTRGSLFVSQRYILDQKGFPIKEAEASVRTDSVTGQPIPNRWFTKFNLSALERNAAFLDPDNDGFTNEEEWRNGTDPTNKDSHPPYVTKLFLKQVTRVPFRLVFKVFNGEANKPRTWEFQIDTVDFRQPTTFLKIGETVPNTHFKLVKYEFKEMKNVKIDLLEDVSELTLVNLETKEPVVLRRGQETDAGDTYALFDYQWPPAAGEIRVKKLQEFALRPETGKDQLYQLVTVEESKAEIRLADGRMHTVIRDPRKAGK